MILSAHSSVSPCWVIVLDVDQKSWSKWFLCIADAKIVGKDLHQRWQSSVPPELRRQRKQSGKSIKRLQVAGPDMISCNFTQWFSWTGGDDDICDENNQVSMPKLCTNLYFEHELSKRCLAAMLISQA